MTFRWIAAAILLQTLGAGVASADGRGRVSPVYIGQSSDISCRPGPRRRYQVGRRCVWAAGRAPVITMRVPSRQASRRRGAIGRSAAFTPQVPPSIRRGAGPLGTEPRCPPWLAAQLECSNDYGDDPFVRALIDTPSPATQATLDAYGIPSIDGVPPIVIINPDKVAPDGVSGSDLIFNGLGSRGGDLIFNGPLP